MKLSGTILATLMTMCVCQAQEFDVVSVKPTSPDTRGAPAVSGGPGSSDPALVTMRNIDLFTLVTMAWGIKRYQVSAPEWMSSARFDVTARLKPDATVDQYRAMIRSLLTERFGLTFHHEQKEIRIYDLVISKNGSKLKEVDADAAAAPDGLQPPPPRAGPPPGYHGPLNLALPKEPMDKFAALLSGLLDQPVEDATGLKGVYDVKLHALVGSNPTDASAENPMPSLFDAVQDQLGLRLAPRKDMIEVLVIDHAEKTPEEN
jgi:uncharacterized protein (TIGR03435 family)